MADDDLIVWGVESTRTMRVHWMLHELGLAYETRPIGSRTGETNTDAYARLNPRQKIPVLQHGPVVLSESASIALYLSERFAAPDGFHVPRDAVGRARLNEWCFFVMTELDAHTLYVIRRHDGLKEIYGEAPIAVAAAERYFLKQLDAMAGQVGEHGDFLLGAHCSVADILMMTCLDWACFYGIPLPAAWQGYQARFDDRPAYRQAFAANYSKRAFADARP